MLQRKPIYVETSMKTTMDQLWEATQEPELHQQWDLRFSSITYLPKEKEEDPQHFLYQTRIGFGLSISGEGESVGTRYMANGERASSLKFWSDQPLSLIRKGSGYWKYIPHEQGITFLTQYDYQTRFSWLGRVFDRLIFRPLMGWATAWSFDALRLWLEKGIDPALSLLRSLTHLCLTVILALIWIYQGLVPKLLVPDSGELAILEGTGWFPGYEAWVIGAVGLGEIAFGLCFLFFYRKRFLHIVNVLLLILLALGATVSDPALFVAPFNPVTLSLAMIGLSMIGLLINKDLPWAGNCKRSQ